MITSARPIDSAATSGDEEAIRNKRASRQAWRDRVRNPSLTLPIAATVGAGAAAIGQLLLPGGAAQTSRPSCAGRANSPRCSISAWRRGLSRHCAGESVRSQPCQLEAVIGQFYLAITVARLVTLEVEDRRRSRQ
jgi:hypothetical protein